MRKGLTFSAILAVCAGLITINGNFVYDDHRAIEQNPCVTSNMPVLNIFSRDMWCTPLNQGVKVYRPGAVLIWKALWGAFPGQPLPFRLLTLIFHVLATVFVGLMVWIFNKDNRTATAAGILFAVHAIHAEALGGITWQADVISAAIGMAALLISFGRPILRTGILTAILVLIASTVKESGVIFGAAIVAVPVVNRDKKRLLSTGLPVIIASAAFVAFQLSLGRVVISNGFTNNLALTTHGWHRFLLAMYTVGKAAALSFVPVGLAPNHGYGAIDPAPATLLPVAIPGMLLIAAGIVLTVIAIKTRNGLMATLLILFFGPILLVSNLFINVLTDLTEHLLYIPSITASIILAMAIIRVSWNGAVRYAATGLIAAALMVQQINVQSSWASDASLWQRAVKVEPKAYRSQINYSEILLGKGKIDQGAWHRMLAEYILFSFPGRVEWSHVQHLAHAKPQVRVLLGPAVLEPRQQCTFLKRFLMAMQHRLPRFVRITLPYFKRKYAHCNLRKF